MSENVKKEIFSWIKTLVSAGIFAYIITNFVIVNAQVPTGSMKSTILPGDRLIAFRLSYLLEDPERFDIAVFRFPDDESWLYVKRIIGLPGETVVIKDGKVFINDSETPLDDSFINEETWGDWGPFVVPENSYFMLGDNRNDSKDSRFWDNPFVNKEKILGKAIFKYYPSIELMTDK